jgi:hypothetical protein
VEKFFHPDCPAMESQAIWKPLADHNLNPFLRYLAVLWMPNNFFLVLNLAVTSILIRIRHAFTGTLLAHLTFFLL